MAKRKRRLAKKDDRISDKNEQDLSTALKELREIVSRMPGTNKYDYETVIESSTNRLFAIDAVANFIGSHAEILFRNSMISDVNEYYAHIQYLCRIGTEIISSGNNGGAAIENKTACNLYMAYGNALTRSGRIFAAIDSYYKAINYAEKMDDDEDEMETKMRANRLLYNRIWGMGKLLPACDYDIFFKHDDNPPIRMRSDNIIYCLLFDVFDLSKKTEQMQKDQLMHIRNPDYIEDYDDGAFLKWIESAFPFMEKIIKSPPKLPMPFRTNGEREYRHWVMREHLFLSVFNMLPTIDDRPMMDDIFCDFQGDNREMQIALFDDIKQSFAYARYQYYSCVDSRMNINAYSKPHFSLKLDHDGRTPIAAHGFTEVQELIECYMRLYSILDKIGNLMNSVHDLKIGSKNKKEKPSIRTVASVIDSLSDNPFLVQMKTIFMETNPEYAEDSHEMPFYIPMPSAMHMDSVRNHLAHIGLGFVSDENEDKVSDDVVQYITWSEFLILTDHLMSIVKEAIFTVWASVNYISFSPEMKKKLKSLLFDNKFALLMKYDLLLNISKRE